jgi:ABC-type polysaccharide/polyol phosphate transport system ATPase subunit
MTPTEPAITIDSLSKSYKLYNSRYDRMKEFFHPLRKKYHRKHDVLKNISFQVNRGEVLGIIGKNGSGKSTLLKILNSVVSPTSGSFTCHGRVTALLELGGGFNLDLTGVQNLYYLGAIQGFSRREMDEKIRDILDFADIGEYALQPVNTYSSGMYVRLAFSMAINIDPDILITDEALAVGDVRFQQKCFRRIREFKDTGKTFIICTHSMPVVKDFCTRAIWLQDGEIREEGEPSFVAERYSEFMLMQQKIQPLAAPGANPAIIHHSLAPIPIPEFFPGLIWESMRTYDSYGTREAEITHAALINSENGKDIRRFTGGENIRLLLHVESKNELGNVHVQIVMNGHLGNTIMKLRSNQFRPPFTFQSETRTLIATGFQFPHIGNGRCTLSFGLYTFSEQNELAIHWVHDGLIAEVFNDDLKYKTGSLIVIRDANFEMIS